MASLGGIWELADVLSRKARRTEGRILATYLYTDDDGTAWVQLAGADEPTPVTGMVTADLRRGDVVEAVVGGGTVSVPGNVSSPSVGARVVAAAIAPVSAAVTLVSEATDAARDIAEAAQHVANAIGQHFWADDSGIHVTHATQEDWNTSHSGPNVLLNSVGQLFRDGLHNLVAITTEQGARAISFYDGSGNAAGNITAIFSSAIMRIGYPTGNRVEVTSNGVAARSGSSNNYTLVDSTGFKTYLSNALRMLLDGTSLKVYDGSGTAAANILAQFTTSGAQIGKSNSSHVTLDSDGMELLDGSTSLAEFSTDGVRVGSTGDTNITISSDEAAINDKNGESVFLVSLAESSITTRSGRSIRSAAYFSCPTMSPQGNSHIYIIPATAADGDYLKWVDGFDVDISVKDSLIINRNGVQNLTIDGEGIKLDRGLYVGGTTNIENHSVITTTGSIDYDTTLSGDTGGTGVYFREDIGTGNIGYIRSFGRSGSDRLRGLQIGGHNMATDTWNMLYLLTDKNGNRVVQVSERVPWIKALSLAYTPGDTFSDTIHTAGYVTSSGKDIYYTIPLVKGIEGTLTLTSMTLIARQGGSYIVGSASSGTNVKSLATVSRTAHGLGIKVSLSSVPSGVNNNDVVGVACAYAFSVS